MKKLFYITSGLIVISIISAIATYRYAPLSILENTKPQSFGTTVTTINGTDTLSSSRTTINNNFTALNNGKFEFSDWYATTSARQLTNLGIMSGGLVTVAYGGTASSTLSLNQVLLGNAANGFKVVSGYGIAGQFLTSNGASNAPTWTTGALDYSTDYNWTGTNRFKNLNASSTVANPIYLNTVAYNTPSTQGSAYTLLRNDGSGNLTWGSAPRFSLIGQTNVTAATNWATSTMLTIPSGVMNASSTIQIKGTFRCANGSNPCFMKIVNQNGEPFITSGSVNSTVGEKMSTFTVDIFPNYSVSSQITNLYGFMNQTSGTFGIANQGDWSAESTSSFDLSQTFSVGISIYESAGQVDIYNYSIVVNP